MPTQPSYWKVLTRRKVIKDDGEEESKLNRVLGVFDLTTLGVGSTLGAGVYVLAGQIAKDQAGPSVMISFAIAALASALAGICYAEFGARVPKAGSAYVYSYVCIGEFVAFVIGWNLILEYVIGTAGVCRGISLYLDTLLNDTLKSYFASIAPIQWDFLGEYFDLFAFGLAIIFGVGTAFGVETSTMLNNFCTLLNISVLVFVIIAGSIKADISNWQVDPITNFTGTGYNIGKGGYFPFGIEGTLKGAATCFFGFVGFDCIATTGEEVRNPQKNIPRSIFYSLLIIFLCYFGVSTVLTLMVPYYIQDPNAPLPFAFKEVGWSFAMWAVTIGGLIGLLASLFGALFPIPRIIYSMAEDGLLFRFLGKVSPRFRTPVTGSIFAAFLTGIIAGTFNLAQLVSLLSIGTLLAYTVVAISITILRFMKNDGEEKHNRNGCPLTENSMLTSNGTKITFKKLLHQMFNFQRLSTPTSLSTKIVGSLIILFCFMSLLCGVLIMTASEAIINHDLWALLLLSILFLLIIILLTAISMQPRELYTPIFRVPLVPLVPAISIFINIYLMLQLDAMTWIRFGIWMVIGLPIFIICYCVFDKSNHQLKKRRLSFMEALQRCSTTSNHQLKASENGVCNNALYIESIPQPTREENERTTHNKMCFKLTSGENCPASLKINEEANSLENNIISEDNMSSLLNEYNPQKECCFDTIFEDENSVMAILDDVLEHEDDGMTTPPYTPEKGLDSEIPYKFLKTTTIAVIHNDNERNCIEVEQVRKAKDTEVWQLAFNLVNEILQCDELVLTVESKRKCSNPTQDPIQFCGANKGSIRIRSAGSSESEDENPLHSDNFKNKLSLLIIRPPITNKINKNKNALPSTTESCQRLKPSKSEADMRNMVLRAIKGTLVGTNEASSKKEVLAIPTPPKFDPVLYKTVGKITNASIRTRPSIDKLIEDRSIDTAKQQKVVEEIPFKIRLEALLKRGPSHRIRNPMDLIEPQIP